MTSTANPANVNPSPKARFLNYKPFVDSHRELIQKPELQRGIDFSLLEMQLRQSEKVSDGNSAAAANYRMEGALEFVRTLKTLAEVQVVPKRVPSEGDIDHTV